MKIQVRPDRGGVYNELIVEVCRPNDNVAVWYRHIRENNPTELAKILQWTIDEARGWIQENEQLASVVRNATAGLEQE